MPLVAAESTEKKGRTALVLILKSSLCVLCGDQSHVCVCG